MAAVHFAVLLLLFSVSSILAAPCTPATCVATGGSCVPGPTSCGPNEYCSITTSLCTKAGDLNSPCNTQDYYPECYSTILGQLACINGTCQIQQGTELPGNLCGTPTGCAAGTCVNNVCVGVAPGGSCSFSTECTYGYYCGYNSDQRGACLPRIPLGGNCVGMGYEQEPSVCDAALTASCGPSGVCIAVMSLPSGALCNDPSQCTINTYCRFANDSSLGRCIPATPVTCTLDGNECEVGGADSSYCTCTSSSTLTCSNIQPFMQSPCTVAQYTKYTDCMARNMCQASDDDINDVRSCAQRWCNVELACLQYCQTTLNLVDDIALGCAANDARFVCLPNDDATSLGMLTSTLAFLMFVSL